MNTDLLHSLVEVARQQSYTRASEVLRISQPTVYQHIRQLEHMLDANLVARRGKRIVLTEEGQTVLPLAERMLRDQYRLQTTLLSDRNLLRAGSVDLVAGLTFGQSVLPNALAEFSRDYPSIAVRITLSQTVEQMDDLVANSGCSAAVHSGLRRPNGLRRFPLFVDTLVAIAAPDHPLGRHEVVTARELSEGITCYGPDGELRQQIDGWSAAQGVKVPTTLQLETQQSILNAVLSGHGIGVVNASVSHASAQGGLIVERSLTPPISKAYSLVHRADTPPSASLLKLSEYVVRSAGDKVVNLLAESDDLDELTLE